MAKEFPIGSKVRFMGQHRSMSPGEIYTVVDGFTEYKGFTDDVFVIRDDGKKDGWGHTVFDLISKEMIKMNIKISMHKMH